MLPNISHRSFTAKNKRYWPLHCRPCL